MIGDESKQVAQLNQEINFPVVGIGASAGGIEAIIELVKNLSDSTGMAFIHIQHLDPDYSSNLQDIISRHTTMNVVTAKNKMRIEPNHFYVIPPNKEMAVKEGILILTQRPQKPHINLPINLLFLSMAENYRENAIGVVLSGMASDGAVGLKAIKQIGGITYTQNDTAKYDSMPKAAQAEGGVDFIMSPADIARDLIRISNKMHLLDALSDEDLQPEEAKLNAADEQEKELPAILQMLNAAFGVDFINYKKTTIRRRILRRLLIHKLETVDEYIALLKTNKEELGKLYNDLLINVTHFFRDADAINYLKETILPKLLKNKTVNEPLRIWIAACSTGEEAYSLGMIMHEILGDRGPNLPVQIFATDLSEIAITKARTGIYTANDVQMLTPERLSNFFTKIDGHYRISKKLRDICVFAPHNIFKDPPFSRVDLISCCNVLIYLNNILQKKIMANFHYALNPNGILVLGQSETVGNSTQYFYQVEKNLKIYGKKNDVSSKAMFDMTMNMPVREAFQVKTRRLAETTGGSSANLEKIVDKIILAEFSPAGVVVNHDLDIIQFRGSTSLFLEPSPGQASLNLLKMARSGLAFELRNAANKVIKTKQPEKKTGIELSHKGHTYQVAFQITPITVNNESELLLIVFEEVTLPVVNENKGQFSKDRRVKQLENELLSLREDMRSVLEAQEAANEELQSANEEILSSNEELQSINEELETSKEEIESSNEELMTINQELMVRNDQLSEANKYSEAIIATIRESVLILDSSLKVKGANEVFYATFKITEKETEGVLIYDLENGDWKIPSLKELLEELVPKHLFYHGLEIRHTFKKIGEKIFMVNAKKISQSANQNVFYLVAFEDITEHKQAEMLLKEREAWLRNMTDKLPVMIWVANPDKNFTYLNKTWLAFTGRKLEQEIGIGWTEGIHEEDIKMCLTTYHNAFDKKTSFQIVYRLRRADGVFRWVLNSAVPSYDSNKIFTGYIGSVTEITNKKLIE